MRTFLIAFSVAAAAGLATAALWPDAPVQEPSPGSDAAAAETREEAAAAPAQTAEVPEIATEVEEAGDEARRLELPDGTSVPTLNGAVDVRSLKSVWDPHRPYSPIVERYVEPADGTEWYRHADGTYSTTMMIWREDLGRMDGKVVVMHPNPDGVQERVLMDR